MDTREEPSIQIAGAEPAETDPSSHHDDNEERRTRIMELAQQQQMTIQLLDEVVSNQRNLQENRLRRRRRIRDDGGLGGNEPPGNDNNNVENEPNIPSVREQRPPDNHPTHHHREGGNVFTLTQIYLIASVLFAFLAVVTSPSSIGMSVPLLSRLHYSFDTTAKNDAVVNTNHGSGMVEKTVTKSHGGGVENYLSSVGNSDNGIHPKLSSHQQDSSHSNSDQGLKKMNKISSTSESSWGELFTEAFENIRDHYKDQYLVLQNFWMYGTLTNLTNPPSASNSQQDDEQSAWSIFSWTWGRKRTEESNKMIASTQKNGGIVKNNGVSLYSVAMDAMYSSQASGLSRRRIEEEETKSTSPSLARKILSSTPRLIAIANLLLALVYLAHAAVADLFLGTSYITQARQQQEQQQQGNAADEQSRRQRRIGRERLGGYLLFKLLLISSVLDPGTEDILILFSWYMLLSFLRSLTHIAGSTANRASQSGQPPSPGTLHLLIAVLVCNSVATSGCIKLFQGAGSHTLFLLTCDCALVAVDALAHMAKYFGYAMEERRRRWLTSLEDELGTLRRSSRERLDQYRDEYLSRADDGTDFDVTMLSARSRAVLDNMNAEVARLEQEVERGELMYRKVMEIANGFVFGFEMSSLIFTMVHFMHIWAWHGASLGLVDFVLALHLHSTISIIGEKISVRRSAYRIGAQLSSHFEDASDLDIRKASAAGDVCCICLNGMSVGNVKKVGCGHLFHTLCLREVVERERSIHAARCPLCRANLITGRQVIGRGSGTENNNVAANQTGQEAQAAAQIMQNNAQLNDTSLLRFSTEGWLPSWLPVPAFSFEVVRRETPIIADRNPNPGRWQRFFRRGGQVEVNDDDNDQAQPQEQQQQQGETSVWRRLLILFGIIPMSQEEETIAMEQLVDMFPQYERGDLLRELRARRSAEAVVESILLGVFSGVARGNQ